MMKNVLLSLLVVTLVMPLTGCSVKQAATINKPQYETELLAFGRPRSHVLTQLGEPSSSRLLGNNKVIDEYEMTRNSRGWGIMRAGAYSFLNVATFGAWELIGTPLEGWIQQDQNRDIILRRE